MTSATPRTGARDDQEISCDCGAHVEGVEALFRYGPGHVVAFTCGICYRTITITKTNQGVELATRPPVSGFSERTQ